MGIQTAAEPTAGIIGRLLSNIVALFQTYGELAGHEARATARDLVLALILFGVALLAGILLLAMLVVTAVLLVALVVPTWLAALIVTAATALIVALCVLIALGRLRRRRLRAVAQSFKEDMRWLRAQLLERN